MGGEEKEWGLKGRPVGGGGVQREKTNGGVAKGLGALLTRLVRTGVVLHART